MPRRNYPHRTRRYVGANTGTRELAAYVLMLATDGITVTRARRVLGAGRTVTGRTVSALRRAVAG